MRRDRDKLETVAQFLLKHESMDAAQFQLVYDDPAALEASPEAGEGLSHGKGQSDG